MLWLRNYFQRKNCAKESKIYVALANAEDARILEPVYILIFNFNLRWQAYETFYAPMVRNFFLSKARQLVGSF